MKVLFDARMMGPRQRGIGRYIQELLPAMVEVSPKSFRWSALVIRDSPALPAGVGRVEMESRWYTFGEQWEVPWLVWRERPHIFHVPHFNVPVLLGLLAVLHIGPALILTIHDCLLYQKPLEQPTTLPRILWRFKYIAFRLNCWFTLRGAARIIAVSEQTRRDLLAILPKRMHGRLCVVREGMSQLPRHDCRKQSCAVERVGYRYVLTVGSSYPRKNLLIVWRVLQRLWETRNHGLHWVHVGPHDPLSQSFFCGILQEEQELYPKQPSRIHAAGFATDEQLATWYAHSVALLYPSSHEGYGLPPLEALGCSSRVISTMVPSLEGVEDAAGLTIIGEPLETTLYEGVQKALDANFSRQRAGPRPGRWQFLPPEGGTPPGAVAISQKESAAQTIAIYRESL